ncbi:hypothetical protein D3C72_2414980 [compost metagenome]
MLGGFLVGGGEIGAEQAGEAFGVEHVIRVRVLALPVAGRDVDHFPDRGGDVGGKSGAGCEAKRDGGDDERLHSADLKNDGNGSAAI